VRSVEVSVEVAGGPLGLQEHEELVKCRGCLWVVPGKMKVGKDGQSEHLNWSGRVCHE